MAQTDHLAVQAEAAALTAMMTVVMVAQEQLDKAMREVRLQMAHLMRRLAVAVVLALLAAEEWLITAATVEMV
jgi:hypothetical protein